jgi:hypothetical protein
MFGVSFKEPWVKISFNDYIDEANEDGWPYRAVAQLQDVQTGSLEHRGILDEDED